MKAMKSPMPAAVPCFRQSGMSLTMCSDFGECEEQENQAGEEHDAERGLPGDAAADDDRIGEVCIQRHAGRERDGIVGPQTHYESCERRRDARCKEDAVRGHPGFGKNAWVDDNHVSHRHKRGQTGEQLAANRRAIFLKLEKLLKQRESP